MHRPLADEIRPSTLDEVVGQKHILGPGGLLRRVIESGEVPNMAISSCLTLLKRSSTTSSY